MKQVLEFEKPIVKLREEIEDLQKKLAVRLVRAFGPSQLSWLKQFFAFPASEHPKTGIC